MKSINRIVRITEFGYLMMLTSNVIVALVFRVVQKPINRIYVLIMAPLRLLGGIIQGIKILYRFLTKSVPGRLL